MKPVCLVIGAGALGIELLSRELGEKVSIVGNLIACTGECTPNFGVVITSLNLGEDSIPIHAGLKMEPEPMAATLH